MLRLAACAAPGVPQAFFCLRALWRCGRFPPTQASQEYRGVSGSLYIAAILLRQDKHNQISGELISPQLTFLKECRSKGQLSGASPIPWTTETDKASTRTCQSHFASSPCLWQEQHYPLHFLSSLKEGSVFQRTGKKQGQFQLLPLLLQDRSIQSANHCQQHPPRNLNEINRSSQVNSQLTFA